MSLALMEPIKENVSQGYKSYEFIQTPEQFYEVLEKQIKPYYKNNKKPLFAIDLETYSFFDSENTELYKVPKPIKIFPKEVCNVQTKQEKLIEYEGYVSTFQLGANPRIFNKQWIFDIKSLGEQIITDNLKDILENSIIIGHNIKYELSFFMTQFDIWLSPERIYDTMLIDQILIAGRNDSVSLGEAYKRYLDYGWFIADTGKSFYDYDKHKEEMQLSNWAGELTEIQLQYAADDVRLIHYLYEEEKEHIRKFQKQYPKSKIIDIIKLECSLLPELTLMELRGINFDSSYHFNEVIPYLEQKAKEAYSKASSFFPDFGKLKTRGRGVLKTTYREPINFASWQQVVGSLKTLGIEVPNSREDTLKANRHKHPVVEYILQYRKADSLLDKFGYKLPRFVHENGKIHPNFRQIGTETGRFSCNNPNMQQIPARENLFKEKKSGELFRKIFITDEDSILIDSDFSNIEPRLIAQISQDENLINAFKNNVDYHGFTAKNLLELDEIPAKGTHEREVIGKIGNLAMGYLAGDKKTAQIMYIHTLDEEEPVIWTPEEAALKKQAYFNALPQVKEKIESIREKIESYFENFNSLVEFKGRRPVYTIFTEKFKRHRSWYLTERQEELARIKVSGDPREHLLHKWYKTINEETGRESYWNDFNKLKSNIIREAYNFLIQCEAANILKISIKKLSEKFKEHNFDPFEEGLVLTIHDELLVKVKKEHVHLGKQLVEEAMLEAAKLVLIDVPVKCSIETGNSWSEAK